VAADYPYFDQNDPVPAIDDAKIPHTTLKASDPGYAAAERGRISHTNAFPLPAGRAQPSPEST
jgi:hypothetical protein